MNKKLYVGNLPFSMQPENLQELFATGGRNVVSANVITERGTGRSRGFGFVEFENEGDAQKAIDELNGKEIDGRAITVSEAREMNKTGGSGGGNFRGGNRSGGGFKGERSGGGGFRGGNRGGRSDRW